MSSKMSLIKSVSYAPEAWKLLNGMFCVYKPSRLSVKSVRTTLCNNLCRVLPNLYSLDAVCGKCIRFLDLNELEKRKTSGLVTLKGSVCYNKAFEVEVVPNYADDELVVGPRYQEQDVRLSALCGPSWHTSGVFLMTVNKGCFNSLNMNYKNFLRKYEIKGIFGIETKDFMSDSIVVERTTYRHVKQSYFDKVLASIQSTHQALAFKYSGIDIQSQAAYDMASTGLVKPCSKSDPLIYSIKCTEFNLPHFTLELHCINETGEFLAELVHDIGIDMRSNAACVQLRRTQLGPFLLPHALLRKHWTLEHVLNNVGLCKSILSQESSVEGKSVKRIAPCNFLEEMQNVAREDLISET